MDSAIDSTGNETFRSWIGLNDRQNEGTWVWESGSQLSAEVAAHWGNSEPNNYQGEDCVVVSTHSGLKMHDSDCSSPNFWTFGTIGFVCQKRSDACA